MKRKLRLVLTIIFAGILMTSTFMAARQRKEYEENTESYKEAAKYAGFVPPELSSEMSSESWSDTMMEDNPAVETLEKIDLTALQEINKDVTGWIYIPDTELSYPLLHGDDNDYYLKHTWDGIYNSGGSVFCDWRCEKDLNNFNTIIYGHRMRNGSMFAPLKNYRDEDFWHKHPTIYIADKSGVHAYDIFAAWEPGVTSIVYRVDFETENGRKEFLDMCLKESLLETGIIPDETDKILTLSTCTGNGYATRWVVQAVERKEKES